MDYRGIKTLKAQVEHCLINFPDTRNSDIALTIQIWKTFYPTVFVRGQKDGKTYVSIDALYDLPREDNVKRVRATFQNDRKLYLPTDWKIAKQRGILEDEWRVAVGYPTKESTGTSHPNYVPPSEVKV